MNGRVVPIRQRAMSPRVASAASAPPPPQSAAAGLPLSLRVYIVMVCTAAAFVLGNAINSPGVIEARALITLLLLSLLASIVKVEISIPGNASTLTACHVIDLITLVIYGTNTAVIVSAWGAWTQCTFRSRRRNAAHKTAFSIASLALTAFVTGHVLMWLSAARANDPGRLPWESLAAAATTTFVINSGLVAAALAMASRRPFISLWFEFFFSMWPSYLIGAVLAAAIIDGVRHQSFWLAPLLATALALIHRNHQSLAERISDSMKDPLTGLHNQRFISTHVDRELARARRAGHPMALVVVDVDDFKSINDREGHVVGDRALRRVADVLCRVVRDYDVCARYGGDEFVVVMSGCSEDEAARRMEEATRMIAAAPESSGFGGPIRISVGVSVYPEDGDRFESLFAVADSRMYRCKQRNASGA
jgi:diguanylate cyclase (GGDEF)-like protein